MLSTLEIVASSLEMKNYWRPSSNDSGEACPILLNFLENLCARTKGLDGKILLLLDFLFYNY